MMIMKKMKKKTNVILMMNTERNKKQETRKWLEVKRVWFITCSTKFLHFYREESRRDEVRTKAEEC